MIDNFIEKFKKHIINYDFLHFDNVNKINVFTIFCINNNI